MTPAEKELADMEELAALEAQMKGSPNDRMLSSAGKALDFVKTQGKSLLRLPHILRK